MSSSKFQHAAFTSPFSLPVRPAVNHARLTPRRRSIVPVPVPVTSPAMTHTVPTASDGDVVFSTTTTTTHTNVPDGTPATTERPFESASLNNSISNSGLATVPTSPGDATQELFSVDDIAQIVEAVEDSELADFRYEQDGVFIEITCAGGLGFNADGHLKSPTQAAPPQYLPATPPPVQYVEAGGVEYDDDDEAVDATEVAGEEDFDNEATKDSDKQDPDQIYDTDFVVTSNRVGFFFSGAKNKPPLVNLGDTVAFNQPVCIIEQLGQQYVYLSEASGKVVKLFVEDGDAVEFGTQIMVIRPD